MVAIALTVYGIETPLHKCYNQLKFWVAIALTVYGIETQTADAKTHTLALTVAIALTVYGIETTFFNEYDKEIRSCNSTYRLRY